MIQDLYTQKWKTKQYFICIFLGISVSLLYLIITHINIGLTPDGFTYFEMSRSILHNLKAGLYPFHGVTRHFPPLYPALLSLFSLAGLNLFYSARFIGWLVFLINAYLYYFIVLKKTGSVSLAIVYTYAILLILILIFASALTEPLFYLLILLFFLLIEYNHEISCKMCIVLMLASLLRYAGISLFLTYVIIIALKYRGRVKLKGFLIGLFSVVPIVIYTFTGSGVGERNISFKFHGITKFIIHFLLFPFNLFLSFDNIGYVWQYPFTVRLVKLVGIFIVILGIYWPAVKYFYTIYDSRFKFVLKKNCIQNSACIFVFVYIGFVLFARIFIDGYIPANLRIFSPILISSVFLIPRRFLYELPKNKFFLLYYSVVLVLGALTVYKLYNVGKGYTSIRWKKSESIKFIKESGLVDTCKVYSNVPEVIKIYLGKPALMVPQKVFPSEGRTNLHLLNDINLIYKAPGCKAIMYFKDVKHRMFLVTPEYFMKYGKITEIELSDGLILIVN